MTPQECHSTCHLSYFSFVLLGIKLRTLNLVGKCSVLSYVLSTFILL